MQWAFDQQLGTKYNIGNEGVVEKLSTLRTWISEMPPPSPLTPIKPFEGSGCQLVTFGTPPI